MYEPPPPPSPLATYSLTCVGEPAFVDGVPALGPMARPSVALDRGVLMGVGVRGKGGGVKKGGE